jgi:hypothetical protein
LIQRAQSLTSLASKGAGPYNLALRSQGLGADSRCDELADPLVQVGTALTRPAGDELYSLGTLGAARRGAGPTVSQHWKGDVRYFIVDSKHYSAQELEQVRQCLISAGLIGSS